MGSRDSPFVQLLMRDKRGEGRLPFHWRRVEQPFRGKIEFRRRHKVPPFLPSSLRSPFFNPPSPSGNSLDAAARNMSTPPDGTALKVGITPSRPKLNPREHFGPRKLRGVGLGLPARGDGSLRSHKMRHLFAGLRLPHPIFPFRSQSIGYKIHERSAMSRPTHSCEAGDRAREGGGRPCVRDEEKIQPEDGGSGGDGGGGVGSIHHPPFSTLSRF